MMSFSPVTVFKNDSPEDVRLGNFVQKSLENSEIVILGYPDDEGIKNNGGRLGAKDGPNGIRSIFYKTTPHLELEAPTFYDLGNLEISADIETRHQFAKKNIFELLQKDKTIISLGGGHDYAYPDGAGFIEDSQEGHTKPLIINFDAHMDVRPLTNQINSGTPFYRLLTDYEQEFDFIEVGLQQVCNSKHYYQWAKNKGMKSLWLEDFKASGKPLLTYFLQYFESIFLKKPPTFLSIDIDAFSAAYAPGASQSWPYGLSPDDFFPLLHLLVERLNVKLLGIYEVSPPLDENLKTQRLAAQIMHRFIYRY